MQKFYFETPQYRNYNSTWRNLCCNLYVHMNISHVTRTQTYAKIIVGLLDVWRGAKVVINYNSSFIWWSKDGKISQLNLIQDIIWFCWGRFYCGVIFSPTHAKVVMITLKRLARETIFIWSKRIDAQNNKLRGIMKPQVGVSH